MSFTEPLFICTANAASIILRDCCHRCLARRRFFATLRARYAEIMQPIVVPAATRATTPALTVDATTTLRSGGFGGKLGGDEGGGGEGGGGEGGVQHVS